jgi:hypothetical protein
VVSICAVAAPTPNPAPIPQVPDAEVLSLVVATLECDFLVVENFLGPVQKSALTLPSDGFGIKVLTKALLV